MRKFDCKNLNDFSSWQYLDRVLLKTIQIPRYDHFIVYMLELPAQAAFSVSISVDNKTVSILSLQIFTISFKSFSNELPWFSFSSSYSEHEQAF